MALAGFAGAGLLVYGAAVEARRLKLEMKTLVLPDWPTRLSGYRLGLIADLHVVNEDTAAFAREAVLKLLAESPDMVAIVGDFVGYWKAESPYLLEPALEPLLELEGDVVAIPGNHDHFVHGGMTGLKVVLEEFGVRLLQNECWSHQGINWVGIDSGAVDRAMPRSAMEHALMARESNNDPIIALWHEPDLVDELPAGASLMLAGHSHGGQFVTPWGWPPMTSRLGRKYLSGFFPHAPTPLYVSRGVGTTGPPSRWNCPPEVTVLTLCAPA